MQFWNANLQKVIVHKVGNKLYDEGFVLAKGELELEDQELKRVLVNFFLTSFKNLPYFKFTHPASLELNDINSLISEIFSEPSSFVSKSEDLCKILYDCSGHPKIKGGELYVAYFTNCTYHDELVDALGIFKSESKETFLKIEQIEDDIKVDLLNGINTKKLEKGALIFNTEKTKGYAVNVVDITSGEAQYWKEQFLKINPIGDNYDHTKTFMSIAKEFVTKQLNQEHEVTKAEQIDYLNKSVDYFKSNSHFDEMEFTQHVFENPSVIDSFDKFKTEYVQEKKIDFNPDFEISSQAVKKQAKAFKRVLKLDKNFDIYIHGDKELIEKGVEPDGRKYYKIYYKEEE